MKTKDLTFFGVVIFIAVLIFSICLNGCTPFEIKETEKVAEDILEEELKEK